MEFVYVVRRRDLFEHDSPQGFHRLSPAELESRYVGLARSRGFFVERDHAEKDSSLKQIIPYCVVLNATPQITRSGSQQGLLASGEPRALKLRRLPKQGERRLHDKLSIGIGGHLNPVDAGVSRYDGNDTENESKQSVLDAGVLRELGEELHLHFATGRAPRPIPLGVLNDDSTPVGSVHFGIVFAVVASDKTTIRETDRMAGEWSAWSALRDEAENGANFETWSSLLLRSITSRDLRGAIDPNETEGADSQRATLGRAPAAPQRAAAGAQSQHPA